MKTPDLPPLPRRGLQLDRVVLLGRTLAEYQRFFGFDPSELAAKRVVDIAAGVSSFTAEIASTARSAVAFDPIYGWPAEKIRAQSGPDLDKVVREIGGLSTYKWDFYQSPEGMRAYRNRACQRFLDDFRNESNRYICGSLPKLPFENDSFDRSFVSYFLFVYEEQFSCEFHRESLLELMRVTKEEARIYPLVTFEAAPSRHLNALMNDRSLGHLEFEIVPTDFEFLVGSASYLRIRRR